jgi:hypothetical protein
MLYQGDKTTWTPEVTGQANPTPGAQTKTPDRRASRLLQKSQAWCDQDPAIQAGRLRVDLQKWHFAKSIT